MLSLYVYYVLYLTIKTCLVNVLIPLWSRSSGSWSFHSIMSCCLPAQSCFRLILELPESLFWILQASWRVAIFVGYRDATLFPALLPRLLSPPASHLWKEVGTLLVSSLK